MTQAFYRKWRPRNWDEVVSQEHVVQTLRNAVRTGHTGHAYLLAGPRGTGKTTTARLLAKALNCLAEDPASRPCDQCEHCQSLNEGRFLDLIEIDAASNTSVDDVRSLRDKINFAPTQGRYKVYIIDEVHMLSTAAFNALLKTLEEPPPHAIFILATTEVHKIPATVLSRCQRHEFRRIPVGEIVRHLREMAASEGLQIDEDALTLIARQATGAMRDAISLLDQLASTGSRVTLAEAQVVLGTATSTMVVEMIEALLARDAAHGLALVQSALDAGTDARQFARQVVEYLRGLLLVRMGNADSLDATAEMRATLARHAQGFETPRLLDAIRLFNNAAVDNRSAWHPGLGLELALAECVTERPAAEIQPAAAPQPAAAAQPAAAQPAAQPAARAAVDPARIASAQQAAAQQAAAQQSAGAQPPAARPARQETPAPAEDDVPEMPPFDLEESAPPAPARPAGGPARSPQQDRQASRAAQPPQSQPPAQNKPTAQSSQPAQSAPQGEGQSAQPANRTVTHQELNQNWARIRQMVKSKKPLSAAVLNSCRSVVLKENTLILGFQSEVVKSKMETVENIDLLRQAIQAILGANLAVRCVVVSGQGTIPGDVNVDGDGMVGTALDLGGKIVYEE